MDKKEAYRQKKEAQMRIFNAKLEELRARGAKARAEAKIEYLKQIELLQAKQEAARRKLAELAGSGEETWTNLRAGVESAIDEFRKAVDTVRGKDRKDES